MQFSEEDRERLFGFYDPAIEGYGSHDVRALRWSEWEGQQERFRVLAGIGVADGASILDVGCGFGDLYQYLTDRLRNISYLGIDINPAMITVAERKYPDARFEVADFGEWNGETFDWALASGAFSFKIPHYRDVYFRFIQKMFEHSVQGIAFNMLDSRFHIDDTIFATYDIEEVEAFGRGITPRVEVNNQYLRQDFTVYLYK